MRSTLSAFFTGARMRQMYSNVAVVGRQMSNTIKDQIKPGQTETVDFEAFATKFTVDVS